MEGAGDRVEVVHLAAQGRAPGGELDGGVGVGVHDDEERQPHGPGEGAGEVDHGDGDVDEDGDDGEEEVLEEVVDRRAAVEDPEDLAGLALGVEGHGEVEQVLEGHHAHHPVAVLHHGDPRLPLEVGEQARGALHHLEPDVEEDRPPGRRAAAEVLDDPPERQRDEQVDDAPEQQHRGADDRKRLQLGRLGRPEVREELDDPLAQHLERRRRRRRRHREAQVGLPGRPAVGELAVRRRGPWLRRRLLRAAVRRGAVRRASRGRGRGGARGEQARALVGIAARCRLLLLPLRMCGSSDVRCSHELDLVPGEGDEEDGVEEGDAGGNEAELHDGPRAGLRKRAAATLDDEVEDEDGQVRGEADEEGPGGFPAPVRASLACAPLLEQHGERDEPPGEQAQDGLHVRAAPERQALRADAPLGAVRRGGVRGHDGAQDEEQAREEVRGAQAQQRHLRQDAAPRAHGNDHRRRLRVVGCLVVVVRRIGAGDDGGGLVGGEGQVRVPVAPEGAPEPAPARAQRDAEQHDEQDRRGLQDAQPEDRLHDWWLSIGVIGAVTVWSMQRGAG